VITRRGFLKACGFVPATLLTAPVVVMPAPTNFMPNLPANTWTTIPSTKLVLAMPLIDPAFHDFGSGGFSGVESAWSGAAFSAKRGKLYVFGGGHLDSSNNGLYTIDLTTGQVGVACQPTPYTQAQWTALQNDYNTNPASPRRWNSWTDGERYSDYLTDAQGVVKPTATHTYGAMCDCAELGMLVIPHASRYWHFHYATGLWEKGAAYLPRSGWKANMLCFWDEVNKKVITTNTNANDYWGVSVYDPIAKVEIKLEMNTGGLPGVKYNTNGMRATRMTGTRKLLCLGAGVAWTINLDNLTAPIVNIPITVAESGTLSRGWNVYANNKMYLLQSDGALQTFDPATGAFAMVATTDAPPPMNDQAQINYCWGRYFLYQGCICVAPGVGNDLYVLRPASASR